jgi:hypothetical protein
LVAVIPYPRTVDPIRDERPAVLAIGAVALVGICVSIIGLATAGDANGVTKAAYALSLISGTVTLVAVTVGYTSGTSRRKPAATPIEETELWEQQLESLAEMGEQLLLRRPQEADRDEVALSPDPEEVYFTSLGASLVRSTNVDLRRARTSLSVARINAARAGLGWGPVESPAMSDPPAPNSNGRAVNGDHEVQVEADEETLNGRNGPSK